MPWKSSDADEHIKGLTSSQKSAWAKIANSVLADCEAKGESDCDGKAIRIANSRAKNVKTDEGIITEEFRLKRIKWKDIETKENDDGLLVKGVPVFKTGTHKGNKYDEKYIDEKIIKQFDPNEDVPLQADHSDSWSSTLGWIKKIYRKGKMMLADLLLVDDNAITRWKKGLMKKWSVSINKDTGKLHEISAVAFPAVKEASIHGEAAGVEMRDYEVEEKKVGQEPGKKEVVEIEAREERPEAAPAKNSEGSQKEVVQITEDEINSLDSNVETHECSDGIKVSIDSGGKPENTILTINGKKIKGSDDISFYMYKDMVSVRYSKVKTNDDGTIIRQGFEYRTPRPSCICSEDSKDAKEYENSLPDSSFALIKNPVKNKADDRALPYKDANGIIDPALTRNALADIDKVKGFSSESISEAKGLLVSAAKKAEIEETKTENKMSDEKKTDAQESTLLKEAMEKEVKMSEEIKDKDTKITELTEGTKKKDEEITEFKVDKEIADLKADGKLLPAQEEKTKAFMLSLDDEARAAFVEVLKDSKAAVKLGEEGTQESSKEENKLDLEKMSAEDIEVEIEKYAKEKGVPVDDARDIFYEKHSKKE